VNLFKIDFRRPRQEPSLEFRFTGKGLNYKTFCGSN
jgi:hypothetical protein